VFLSVDAAISLRLPLRYEIASVILFPRNDEVLL